MTRSLTQRPTDHVWIHRAGAFMLESSQASVASEASQRIAVQHDERLPVDRKHLGIDQRRYALGHPFSSDADEGSEYVTG